MKKFGIRTLATILVVIMAFALLSAAFAATRDDVISPAYLYTQRIKASLSISSGKAVCSGYIRANDSESSISITVTLYKKSGTSWNKVTSWNASKKTQSMQVEKTKQVSQGTYKVVVTGSVTTVEGKKENVKATSVEVTYSK